MKPVTVKYIDGGVFQSVEETSPGKIKIGETCVVLKRADFAELKQAQNELKAIYKAAKVTEVGIKHRETVISDLLNEAAAYMADCGGGPNETWWKRYFLIDGAHMIQTEDGWMNGATKSVYEPSEILDEVNAPEATYPEHKEAK
jgi:hypothetical protein